MAGTPPFFKEEEAGEETRLVEGLVRDKMEHVYPLSIPLKTHLGWGKSWAEAK